ncbi:hypothetical protein [Photobacterium kasasachensis]|uniref:hypothetical protein n=1 Tax=Photobacterium kasasachensis TaxID=2910240 RepID=UPI003D13023D
MDPVASSLSQISLSFRWKKKLGRPESIAILYAVKYKHQDCQALLRALPQFCVSRLEAALTDLLASKLIDIQLGKLVLSDDAVRLDQLTQSPPLVIPATNDTLSIEECRVILSTLGITNTAVALNAVYINATPLVEEL